MVSVVVPNYNHSRYLKQRLESILQQTYQDFELIILDDCSTDDSASVIESFRVHPKVSSIQFNAKNSGSVFNQWKRGIDLARGKYLWIAESDDFAERHFLERMVEVMEAEGNQKIVLVHSNAKLVDENGNWDGRTLKDIDDGEGNTKFNIPLLIRDGKDELEKSLSFCSSIINASGVLIRLDALKKIDLDYTAYKYSGDWAVYVRLATMGPIAFVNQNLNNFRFHLENTSKKARNDAGIFNEHRSIILFYLSWLKSNGRNSKSYETKVRFKILEVFNYLSFIKAAKFQWGFIKRAPVFWINVIKSQIGHSIKKKFR